VLGLSVGDESTWRERRRVFQSILANGLLVEEGER